jgi:hypothetical protein
MRDRGCDTSYMSCSDFGAFQVTAGDSSDYCGTDNQGGSSCKSKCCSVQDSYCASACAADIFNPSCKSKCLSDRGC